MKKILLADVEISMIEAWQRFCGDLDFVEIHHGSILDLSVDAVVSPANSFGFMDGGIDLAYSHFFGWHVQERLQKVIRERHSGELLVGMAEIIETDQPHIPFVIAAPTMRVPMVLQETVNPYLAMRAVLLLVRNGVFAHGSFTGQPIADYVEFIAVPGFGTGVGQVGPNTCAHQMRTAIDAVLLGKNEFPKSWADAQSRHQLLYTDRVRNLQIS